MADLDSKYPEQLEAQAGEQLRGLCIASQQRGMFDAVVLDHAAVRLQIRTTDGEKHKLMLMRGEGRLLGTLGGGETQQQGVQALGRRFEAIQT